MQRFTGKFLFISEFEDIAPTIIEAAKDADFILWDGMFTDEELKMRKGWGHSSISQGADFWLQQTLRN